jgi:hypothetical protein
MIVLDVAWMNIDVAPQYATIIQSQQMMPGMMSPLRQFDLGSVREEEDKLNRPQRRFNNE